MDKRRWEFLKQISEDEAALSIPKFFQTLQIRLPFSSCFTRPDEKNWLPM